MSQSRRQKTALATLFAGALLGALAFHLTRHAVDSLLVDSGRLRLYGLLALAGTIAGLGYVVYRLMGTLERLRADNADLAVRCSERSGDLAQVLRRLKEVEQRLGHSENLADAGRRATALAGELATPLGRLRDHLRSVRTTLSDLRAAHAHGERLVALLTRAGSDPRQLECAADALSERLEYLRAARALDHLDALGWDGLRSSEHAVELVEDLRACAPASRPLAPALGAHP
jgi:C4-dicarboxylate-specific signal transduction histidine kinase